MTTHWYQGGSYGLREYSLVPISDALELHTTAKNSVADDDKQTNSSCCLFNENENLLGSLSTVSERTNKSQLELGSISQYSQVETCETKPSLELNYLDDSEKSLDEKESCNETLSASLDEIFGFDLDKELQTLEKDQLRFQDESTNNDIVSELVSIERENTGIVNEYIQEVLAASTVNLTDKKSSSKPQNSELQYHNSNQTTFHEQICPSQTQAATSGTFYRRKGHILLLKSKAPGQDGAYTSFFIPDPPSDSEEPVRSREHSPEVDAEEGQCDANWGKKWRCTTCSRRFVKATNLMKHRRKVHKEHRGHGHEATFLCEECGFLFKTEGQLQKHRWIHAGHLPVEFPCDQCDKVYKYSSNLRHHKRRFHDDQDSHDADTDKDEETSESMFHDSGEDTNHLSPAKKSVTSDSVPESKDDFLSALSTEPSWEVAGFTEVASQEEDTSLDTASVAYPEVFTTTLDLTQVEEYGFISSSISPMEF